MARNFDLEDRLISFSVTIIKLTEQFPRSFSGTHLASQMVRSATAPSLNYGEAQAAESRSDFIHKMKVALKELRETSVSLRIVLQLNWPVAESLTRSIKECNELVSIFVKSIRTAEYNRKNSSLK